MAIWLAIQDRRSSIVNATLAKSSSRPPASPSQPSSSFERAVSKLRERQQQSATQMAKVTQKAADIQRQLKRQRLEADTELQSTRAVLSQSEEHVNALRDAFHAKQAELGSKAAECQQLRQQLADRDTLPALQNRYEQRLALYTEDGHADEKQEQTDSLPVELLKDAVAWHSQLAARLQSMLAAEERKAKADRWTCKVCMDRETDTQLRPCRHTVTCSECAKKLRNCPICRAVIKSRAKLIVG